MQDPVYAGDRLISASAFNSTSSQYEQIAKIVSPGEGENIVAAN